MGDLQRIPKTELAGMPSSKFVATEMMEEMGYNPIKELVLLVRELQAHEEQDYHLILQAHKELAKYFTPQMRSVDVNINQSNSMTVNILRFDDDEGESIPVQAMGKKR